MKVLSQIILVVNIYHDFFQNGIWKNIEVHPSTEARASMEAHRINVFAQPKGFFLVRDTLVHERGEKQAVGLPEESSLRIMLAPQDKGYPNFTAAPDFNPRRNAWYFTNHDKVGGLLSLGEKVGSEDLRTRKPKVFSFKSEMPAGSPVRIFHNGEIVCTTWVDEAGNALVDLKDLPEQAFELKSEAKEFKFFTTCEPHRRYPIYLDIVLDGGLEVPDPVPACHLRMPSREVKWRYAIHTGDRDLPDLKVIDPEERVQFSKSEAEDDGKRLFTTTKALPLQERPPYNFKLINGSNGAVLSERLPHPVPYFLKQVNGEAGAFYVESHLSLQ